MPQLTDDRRKLYERLEAQVRDTPLYEITHIEVPRKCRIFCKEEYRNPTGSHYDRQTVKLLRGFEEDRGRIAPNGTPLAETTTGSSGASFAWMCRVLGYKCIVFIPGDMPSARIEQIKSFEADVRFAPNRGYIRGLVRAFSTFINEGREQFIATNHSKDVEYAPAAMGDAGREILGDLKKLKLGAPAYFVAALGNGISARGIGEVLAAAGTTLIGMEPQESPDVLHSVFPERFKRLYPEGHPTTQHELYGTGPGEDASIQFPNIDAIKERLSDIRLPSRNQWQAVQRELSDIEAKHVGNSSAACLWAALDLANDPEIPPESTIVTVFYDASWRYLPISPNTPPTQDTPPVVFVSPL
jgi:cysteine synthase A